ncbi:MAG: hypothetical protein KatS3mg016_2194 [Fimbriimonadales bacterium]|nr:MAG: hypothetical protein KatS3mg016_2194 [Fimbriimonadales bacterium]
MRRLCRELERSIASGASELPSALQAHIAQCARCQHLWRLEQAYRRGLHAARSEPVPACEVPWTPIQARLAEQKATKRMPIGRPYAYAGGFAVALLAAYLTWLVRAPQQNAPALLATPSPAIRQDQSLKASEPPKANFAPERAVRPMAPNQVASAAPAPRPNRIAPAATFQKTGSRPKATEPLAQAALTAKARLPRQAEAPSEGSASIALNAEPFAVASLPLSQYELHNSLQVEYLPIHYGTPSSDTDNEGNPHDAIICSF